MKKLQLPAAFAIAMSVSIALGVPNAQAADGVSVFATGFNGPRGLKFGPDRYLYVAEAGLGVTAFEVSRRLRAGTPAVYVNENRLQEGVLILHALGLEERLVEPLTHRLREVLGG